jgi:hypothetical protein
MNFFAAFKEELNKVGVGPIVPKRALGKAKARTPRSRPTPGITAAGPLIDSQAAYAGFGDDMLVSGGQPGPGGR